jgi:Spy/CpxP family protein refolding chaperone
MTVTKFASTFLLAAAMSLSLAACDTENEPTDEAARSAETPDASDAPDEVAQRGPHGHHMGKRNPAERLCKEIACTDEQLAEISGLFEARHEAKKAAHADVDWEAKKAEREAMREQAQTKLAAAFRADDFDSSILETLHPPRPDMGDHRDQMIAFAVELHGILTPEQRTKLADQIAERGPMFLHGGGKRGGHHGMRGHHGGKDVKAEKDVSPEQRQQKMQARLTKHVDELCEAVTCTADQRTQLTATFEGVHEERVEAKQNREKPDFSPLADAFRADSLDEAELRAAMDGMKSEHIDRMKGHGDSMGAVIAEVHDILTPEQRGVVADKIEAGELGLMMGHHKGMRGHHGDKPCDGPCDGEDCDKPCDKPCDGPGDKPCDHAKDAG